LASAISGAATAVISDGGWADAEGYLRPSWTQDGTSRCKILPETRANCGRAGQAYAPRAFLQNFHRDAPTPSHVPGVVSSPRFGGLSPWPRDPVYQRNRPLAQYLIAQAATSLIVIFSRQGTNNRRQTVAPLRAKAHQPSQQAVVERVCDEKSQEGARCIPSPRVAVIRACFWRFLQRKFFNRRQRTKGSV
jgi:hypothetical protein